MRRSPHPILPLVALALLLTGSLAMGGQAATREGSGTVEAVALAVAEDSNGTLVGVHATVQAEVLAGGSGQVYVSTKPLAQTDMQGSARLASRVAAATLGVTWGDYDYLVSFRSDSAVIGGPSAGAVMALALATALHNLEEPDDAWTLDPGIAATGTINPDGTIGPVGGIPAKAEGAKAAGLRHFLYPAGLDVATTQVGGQTIAVDMREHCEGLGIDCSPATSLVDVLRAAGIDIEETDAPIPDTTDYRDDLEPSVVVQVQALEDRLDTLAGDPRLAGLAAAERTRVADERRIAEERLAAAREALQGDRFYLAATRAFQGHIQTGRAENLTAFFDAGNQAAQERVVLGALEGCAVAAGRASRDADPLRAAGITALYAVGSAQQRAAQARDLHDRAEALHEQAVRLDDWVESLFSSTFCVERAGTAAWWAALRTTFGAGPSLGDRGVLVADQLEAAREGVAYAAAVLGAEFVAEAASHLAAAEGHAAAGRSEAAVLEAIEAQTSASVAMQTAGGRDVPQAVLDNAVQGAARAIGTARSHGVEPMLAVSLVELSRDQNQTAQALGNLWSARSMALLERAPAPAQFSSGGVLDGAGGATATTFLLGVAIGGGIVAAVVILVLFARRLG